MISNLIQSRYGIILCLAIGIAAFLLAAYVPIGAVAVAIIIGIGVGNIVKPGNMFQQGITYSEKQILSFAIVLMGVNLNFLILRELGYESIVLIVTAIVVTIFSAVGLAKLFKFDQRFALLIGIGNGVCGSSAIAATGHIIGAKEEEIGLSVAIINFLGTIGIFLVPFIGTVVFKFTDITSGILTGNTLQAVGHVAAGGFSISDVAGQTAMIVKMGRILMLTPIILILMLTFSRQAGGATDGESTGRKPGIPLFIIGFVLFSLIPTFGLLAEEFIAVISSISHYALIVAMAGVGLKITFSSILRDGRAALRIGSLVFLVQIIFSSSMAYLLFG